MLALQDVAHRERGTDNRRRWQSRLQSRCANRAGDAELIHNIRNNARRVADPLEPVDQTLRRTRCSHQPNAVRADLAGQFRQHVRESEIIHETNPHVCTELLSPVASCAHSLACVRLLVRNRIAYRVQCVQFRIDTSVISWVNNVRLDLNLIAVLEAIMLERNVTRAAASLSMSQPAVSNALRRARKLTKDQLFLKTATGVQPTSRMVAMWPELHRSLTAIRASFAPDDFDPRIGYDQFSHCGHGQSCRGRCQRNHAEATGRMSPRARVSFCCSYA